YRGIDVGRKPHEKTCIVNIYPVGIVSLRMKHLFVFLFAMISVGAMAQGGYRLYHEEDGLRIYGKWKHEKPFGHGPYMLCVKVKNTGEEMVQASFSVQYFDGPLLAEDFQVGHLCIEGGKTLKGRAGNLCFV